MSESSRTPQPTLATWPVLGIVLALLTGALVLEIALSAHWANPFREPGTWILIGVGGGLAVRGAGRLLTRWEVEGEDVLRRVSLGIWIVTALGGLVSLFL